MTYTIEAARPEDSAWLGPLLLRAWLQAYPSPEAGIDEEWIHEQRGSAATAEGAIRWREFIEEANRRPALLFCRVVRSGTEPVGLLRGRRGPTVALGPMYLLDHAQGRGIGRRMMTEFLTWAGAARISLWVTDYDESAIRFYRRYGSESTGERELWRGRLPNLRMAREAVPDIDRN